MKTIPTKQICIHYNIPTSFIDSLVEYELIEVIVIDSLPHITLDELQRIERLMRLHFDLNVNFEGIDIINNLLNQVDELQEKIYTLQNKLDFYE